MVGNGNYISEHKIWDLLSQIPDPDIPVISITELGIVRQVIVDDFRKITVVITPSYSGCPAMSVFKEEIKNKLLENGATSVDLKIELSPPWTTDWLSDVTKNKLKKYGIAPPEEHSSDVIGLFSNKKVTCPHCNQNETKLTSQFGSTPCKSLWFCSHCQQPFEYFKCH
jgi:ring-1,2-phenylacetyl-CoA epoxidase subunit PaaD